MIIRRKRLSDCILLVHPGKQKGWDFEFTHSSQNSDFTTTDYFFCTTGGVIKQYAFSVTESATW